MQQHSGRTSLASGARPSGRRGVGLIAAAAALVLAGCGQKGPLELPLPARPAPATADVPPPPVLQPSTPASAPSSRR
ncbi:LPS translocon maturation chaperone LptM [Aquabacterium sp. J223]|uniref:LPS translocon maturation chaperone LptM n=1 Tax=Aquabacterium sp. J223 TaxID=2898431 RepID=UPI0021AE2A8B|nr:lipoprotein [Aquabacterium sp. J223]UUX96532.1 lipoprotein [Aquabacterium sp. J223]